MTLLVFGASGQVAQELALRQPDAVFLGRADVDLMQVGAARAAIERISPDVVINAAAYTAVDKAESEEDAAFALNATAPGEMAAACATAAIPLVHISTDYVFRGDGTAPFTPEDPVAPQNAYGRSKHAGEIAVREAGCPHAILRTSWVFSSHGANFVKTMLRLAETRDALNVVDDQIGGPTPAGAIAEACLRIAGALGGDADLSGTYHFSGAPDVSWKDFAEEIFRQAEKTVAVTGIPTSDYPTPAMRPLNSRLDCSLTEKTFGIPRPDWRASLRTILKDINT